MAQHDCASVKVEVDEGMKLEPVWGDEPADEQRWLQQWAVAVKHEEAKILHEDVDIVDVNLGAEAALQHIKEEEVIDVVYADPVAEAALEPCPGRAAAVAAGGMLPALPEAADAAGSARTRMAPRGGPARRGRPGRPGRPPGRSARGARPFRCHQCGMAFVMEQYLARHLRAAPHCSGERQPDDEDSDSGDNDDVTYSGADGIDDVIDSGADGMDDVSAPVASAPTARTPARKRAAHARAAGKPAWPCGECGREFAHLSRLQRHALVHSGEKPFKCELCGNRFTQKNDLKTHVRLHTGERPDECEDCGMTFADKSHLTRHRRIHAGGSAYKCASCGKSFARKDTLAKHIHWQHTLKGMASEVFH